MFGLTDMHAQVAWKVGVGDFISMDEYKVPFFGLGEGTGIHCCGARI